MDDRDILLFFEEDKMNTGIYQALWIITIVGLSYVLGFGFIFGLFFGAMYLTFLLMNSDFIRALILKQIDAEQYVKSIGSSLDVRKKK